MRAQTIAADARDSVADDSGAERGFEAPLDLPRVPIWLFRRAARFQNHSDATPIAIVMTVSGAPTLKYSQNPMSTPHSRAR